MKCFMCKGMLEDCPTTFMVDANNCIVIVKNVPSQVCSQCGEVSYTDNVAAHLEKIANEAQKALSEIAIINYASGVA
ncbi:MAG: type II toxin-antitoxin system MqsA family antitoxin [Oscillospiraceae bacterium]|nr:type II toxin-antitoxin system MqsA family antitoxin [Oscillospiraceae bacterium]